MLNYKLIFFDLDGTLIKSKSSWELVHEHFGTLDKARKALEEYRVGKISCQEFMVKDISFWMEKKKRIHIKEIEEIVKDYELNAGAKDVVTELKRRGIKIIIVTAGINLLAERVGKNINGDIVLSNRLEVDKDGYLVGRGIEEVDLYRKDKLLREISTKEGVPLEKTIAVGDTIYDLNMLRVAGLGLYLGDAENLGYYNIKSIHSLQEILDYVR